MKKIVVVAVVALALVGVWTMAMAEDAKPSATAVVSLPAAELNKAIQGIEEVKKALPADQKDAVAKLDAALKILQAAKAAATQPVAAPATPAAGGGDSFTGPVHATGTRKLPRITLDGTKFDLIASDKADATVKETLAKIGAGATGDYVVKGTKKDSQILVDSIQKK